jgi:hypothetical protein
MLTNNYAVRTVSLLDNDVVDPHSRSRKRRRPLGRVITPASDTRPESDGAGILLNHDVKRNAVVTFVYNDTGELMPREPDHQYFSKTMPCNRARCVSCAYIDSSRLIDCHYHNKKIVTVNHHNTPLNCLTKRVIYLISCKKCYQRYVGETTRPLCERIKEHLGHIRNQNLHTLIVSHFSQADHSLSDFSIKILEVVRESDPIFDRELFWIKLLNTTYPFGLNDNIKGYGIISEGVDPLLRSDHPYLCGSFIKIKRKHRRRRRRSKKVEENICETLSQFTSSDVPQLIRYLRNKSQKTLAIVYGYVHLNNNLPSEILLATKAYLARFYHVPKETVIKDSTIVCKVKFTHPVLDDINLPSILQSRFAKRVLPKNVNRKIKIVYSYDRPFSSKICNHSATVRSLRNMDAVKEVLSSSCTCDRSPYFYAAAEHVITGDLNIITDERLRSIIKKGTRFRFPTARKKHDITNFFELDLDLFILKLSNMYRLSPTAFDEFRSVVMLKFKDRLCFNTNSYKTYKSNAFNKELRKLHEKYVICPADKAAGNYVVICKKFYVQTLCSELGINRDGEILGNGTYALHNESSSSIFRRHSMFESMFGSKITERPRLPILYALPKLHKNPFKFRFIAAATETSMTHLSLDLHRILTGIRQFMEIYCHKIKERTGRNLFWSISNSFTATERLCNQKKIDHMLSADFATLFTKLPHGSVRSNIFRLLDIAFRNNSYVAFNDYRSFMCNDKKYNHIKYYDLEQAKKLVDCVLNECYVNFAGLIFKQVQGVPMGGNASPLLADLSLLSMEYAYMTLNKHTKLTAMRYIDDILCTNDPNFMKKAELIYDNSLQLECTYNGTHCNFLDLNITVVNRKAVLSIYNKTDAFPFRVNRFGYPESCVSSKTQYGVLVSQLIRYGRISHDENDFISKAKELFDLYLDRGFKSTQLRITLKHFIRRNKPLLMKFFFPSKCNLDAFTRRMLNRGGC